MAPAVDFHTGIFMARYATSQPAYRPCWVCPSFSFARVLYVAGSHGAAGLVAIACTVVVGVSMVNWVGGIPDNSGIFTTGSDVCTGGASRVLVYVSVRAVTGVGHRILAPILAIFWHFPFLLKQR